MKTFMKNARLDLPRLQNWETSDISIAATLYAVGAEFLGIQWQDANKCSFSFTDSEDLHRTIDAYWRRQLSVEPQLVLSALRALKAKVHDSR